MRLEAVAAVLTAAGLSSRMGFPKALLDWRGRPLIVHQVAALARCREVVVVLGHEAERIAAELPAQANLRVVIHPGYREGRASSLRAGFRALGDVPQAILVAAVDQPMAPHVAAALCEALGPDAAIAQPVHQGRSGHPILFAGWLLPELLAIDEATEGLRAVVARHRATRVLMPCDAPEVLLDLNRPGDLPG